MSIGIYAFLRIYFLDFGVSVFAQFRTHCAALQPPTPPRSTRRGLSGIECRPVQRVQRPGVCVGARSAVGMVCPGTCPALVLARPALLPVLCSRSGCAGGFGIHLRGISGEPGVGWSVARFPKPKKKAFFGVPSPYPPHPHKTKRLSLCNIPNFPKNTKRPLSRSNLCYT